MEALTNACFALCMAIERSIVLNTTREVVLQTSEGEQFLHTDEETEAEEDVHNVASIGLGSMWTMFLFVLRIICRVDYVLYL